MILMVKATVATALTTVVMIVHLIAAARAMERSLLLPPSAAGSVPTSAL